VTAAGLAARQVHAVAPVEALAPGGPIAPEVGSRGLRAVAGVAGATLIIATIVLVTADMGRPVVGAIALAFVGAGALCLAFSGPIVHATARVARLFGNPGALGAATIERAPQRMWVALVTVMTAVVTTVAVTGATRDAVDSTVASFSSIAGSDLWVSSASPSDYSSTLLPQDTDATVRALPGVAHVIPAQTAFATVGGTRVMLLGVAPGSHRDIYASLPPADQKKLVSGRGVAVSRDLGRAMGVTAGDTITLQTPSGPQRAGVIALIPYFSGMTGTIAMGLDTMRNWFARPGATDLEVDLTPGVDARTVQAAIRKVVAPQVFVYTGAEALTGVSSALDQVIAIISVIAWIVVVVSAVTLLNIFMLSVLDRRREIGALRAIGASHRFALSTVLSEAAAIGVVGGSLGLLLGAAIQYLASLALTDVLSIDVTYQPRPAVLAIGLVAVVICLLGALPPAIRAARMNIAEAVGVD
jgi:putative ABC transport system permease protein